MATDVSYKVLLTALTPPYKVVDPRAEPVNEFVHPDFVLLLPFDWKLATQGESSLEFVSEAGATLTLSTDVRETADELRAPLAEAYLSGRRTALELRAPGKVEVLRQTVKPHSSGDGVEMVLAAALDETTMVAYLGYVTSRKVLNLGLEVEAGRQAAADLFDKIVMRGFRPKLP